MFDTNFIIYLIQNNKYDNKHLQKNKIRINVIITIKCIFRKGFVPDQEKPIYV
jgi:hypothetical protein